MLDTFVPKSFTPAHQKTIAQANEIIAAYQAQGFTLTLRQLYYQFVARALIPNKQSEYKRLGSIISEARLAGEIDWDAIEDRTRRLIKPAWWDSPESILSAVASSYAEDLWAPQPRRVEVWIEKDALTGVIEPACERLRLPFFACRGYTSQSSQHAAGRRFAGYRRHGQKPLVLHFGDHDPSGMDMTRDNRDRLAMFARQGVEVKRLALTWAQIEEYDPPPNPAKETDSRSGPYIEEFGESSWELDALEPTVIDALIQEAVDDVLVPDLWEDARQEEERNKATLAALSDRFDEVRDFLNTDEED